MARRRDRVVRWTTRGLLIVVLLAGPALIVSAPAYAAAAGHSANARVGGYETEPKSHGTNGRATVRDLRATVAVSMSAGDVHYISGTLRLGRASAVTAVTEITACRAHGATHRLDTVLGKAITGQNIKPGRAADALTARFEFRAPSDGVYDCALDAIFINHDAETTGRIYVLSGSVLVDARGPLVAHAQVFTPHKALVTNRTDTALISKYAVPGTVAVVDVIGDVNVTNCYGGYGICPDVNEPDSSSMTSQLIINQLNGDGSLCQQTTDQRLLSPPIDPTVHHYKAYHRQNTVPVLARCTSRTFTVYIRVWRSGGNTFEIENNTQTYTFIFDH